MILETPEVDGYDFLAEVLKRGRMYNSTLRDTDKGISAGTMSLKDVHKLVKQVLKLKLEASPLKEDKCKQLES